MKYFAQLFNELDSTTRTNEKVKSLVKYFTENNHSDNIYAISFLTGRKPKQLVKSALIREWAREAAQIPQWLFEESYERVGDMGELIALLVEQTHNTEHDSFSYWIEKIILPLKKKDEASQKQTILESWKSLDYSGRFVFNKIIGGSFRVGVSQSIVVKAIAEYSGLKDTVISHRLMGNWLPREEFFNQLISQDSGDTDVSRPYPFYLAYQLETELEELGEPEEWAAEWKWDGIRAQLIKRNDEVFIWSRGEELITERFPELKEAAMFLHNGTVLDGELLAWKDGKPMIFGELQRRIGRKNLSKKILEEVPVVFQAFDLLEFGGEDIRENPYLERKEKLREVIEKLHPQEFKLDSEVNFADWNDLKLLRSTAKQRNIEGVLLKRRNSAYGTGRRKGNWWKWKVDPFTVDAVMIYAQRGHGRRASLYTDYTFGIWNEEKLISFAKAYSGLTDEEIRKVDAFVRRNTLEKFGPVRTVKPELVFELSFEGIQLSGRHKSGIAVRFPRITKWRTDKKPEDADTLENIKKLLVQK
ncbi:ATP-dependent DNA ligase [soil metagenome]